MKGFVSALLKEIDIFQGLNLNHILSDFSEGKGFMPPQEENRNLTGYSEKNRHICEMPQGTLDDLPIPHRNYLQSRNFDPDFLAKKYKLKAVYNTGDEKFFFRIICPVFIGGRLVSYVGADVVRKEGIVPYLNCRPEDAVIPVNHCLYNFDSVKDVAVIVEGVTDVWRCGDGFIASFRKGMTREQISLLKSKRPKKVFLLYDPDAEKQQGDLADILCMFFEVEMLNLDFGDPADLSIDEVKELRRMVGI
jgi:hypothetical protein